MRLLNQVTDGGEGGSGGAGGDGGAKPWYGEIPTDAPQEFREWVGTKAYKDPVTALQSNFNLERLIGADKAGRTVVLPKDETDVDGVKAFRAKMGVPATAAEYNLPVPDGQDKALAAHMSGVFHKAGVPAAQAVAITEAWNAHIEQLVTAQLAQQQAEGARQLAALETEWGTAFKANEELANRFMKSAGWDDAKIKLYEQTFGRADMLRTFGSLGKQIGEHELSGGGEGGGFRGDRQAIQNQIDVLRQKRINGQMGEREYLEQVDRLGKMMPAA